MTHTDDFALLQRDPAAWKGQLQRKAPSLRVIANDLDDRKMRQFLAERARNADFAVFRGACITGTQAGTAEVYRPLIDIPGITSPQAGTAEVYRPLIDDLENLERAMGPLARLNADPNRTQSVVLAQLHIVEAAIAPISEARKRVSILGDASTRKDLDGICTALEVMKQLAEHTQTGEGATALAAALLDENGMIKKIRERLLALEKIPGITSPQAGTAEVYRPLIDDLENLERAMGPLASSMPTQTARSRLSSPNFT